jgi:uncharacterized protein (DUF983 family)
MDMFVNAATLFLKGKLFRDLGLVIRQQVIGVIVCAVLIIIARKVGLPLWAAVTISSFIAGALQPYLFKDLKYA